MSAGEAVSAKTQEERERAIFQIFAEISGLPIVQGSIRKVDPPAPDIRCALDGQGEMAFEVVEIVGERFAAYTNLRAPLRKRFREAYGKLPEEARSKLETRLGGPPAVFIAFERDTPPGKWTSAIGPILETLTTHQDDIEAGEFPVWKEKRLRRLGITDMYVRGVPALTGGADGGREDASLHVSEATLVVDPMVELLQKKFNKTYKADGVPIELLAYYASAPPPDDAEWRSELAGHLRERVAASGFRRVWILDCLRRTIVLKEPLS